MRIHTHLATLALAAVLVAPAARAQASGPGTVPVGNMYTPIFGGSAGVAIPIGALADDHAAGYLFGALVEYGVANQPYALRGELLYQRFPLKENHAGND